MADDEFVVPGGADEAEDAVRPGDLDDEAEVEARAALERLDAAEEGRVWGRDGGAVEHGGVDLDLLILGAAGGVEAHPRGRHRRPLLTVERRGSREEGGEKVVSREG